eukprot:Awhi_evm1s2872
MTTQVNIMMNEGHASAIPNNIDFGRKAKQGRQHTMEWTKKYGVTSFLDNLKVRTRPSAFVHFYTCE